MKDSRSYQWAKFGPNGLPGIGKLGPKSLEVSVAAIRAGHPLALLGDQLVGQILIIGISRPPQCHVFAQEIAGPKKA